MVKDKENRKAVCMRIDVDLFNRSKQLIHNRTSDYEDYLRRTCVVVDKPNFIRNQIEEGQLKIAQLEKEYDLEIGLQKENENLIKQQGTVMEGCVETIIKIIENEGRIGLDRIEEIANYRGVNASELKSEVPENYKSKFVSFHPHYKNEKRVTGID